MQSADVLKQIAGDDRDTEHQFTVYPTIRNPIQPTPTLTVPVNVCNCLEKRVKLSHLNLEAVVFFVGKKEKTTTTTTWCKVAFSLIASIGCRFYTHLALTGRVILAAPMPHSLTIYLSGRYFMCHGGGMRGK